MLPLLHDLRHALRLLRKTPGFTVVAILTLGLGIGACTAIYTVVYGVLLRPLPYPEPDRVMHLWQISPRGGTRLAFPDPNYEDLRDQNRTFQALAVYAEVTTSATLDGHAMRVPVGWGSRELFRGVLRTQPRLGRLFLPEEHQVNGARVAMVGHAFWQEHLGGDTNLARHTLTMNDHVYSIVGVMPPGFNFPKEAQVWIPQEWYGRGTARTAHNWRVVGRLRDGVTIDQARADLRTIAQRLRAEYPDILMADVAVNPLHEEMVGSVRRVLLIVLGSVGFLLLVACANVVNLLLTRATTRQRELALRAALGASRMRLLTPFLSESFVLTVAGGALGVAIAIAGVRALLALEPGGLPRLDEIGVSWPVLAFALFVSVAIAMLLGVLAAARAMKMDVYERLKEGGRSQSSGGGSARLRGALVVAQLAVSLVLLVGAGLLGRSFMRVMQQDLGFRTEQIVTMQLLGASPRDDAARARLIQFHDEVEARLSALPGVAHVGGISSFPLSGGMSNGVFIVMDPSAPPPTTPEDFAPLLRHKEMTGQAEYRLTTPGYFQAMGIPLLRGRGFEARDTADAPHVAVITESLAKTRWPDRDPIGLTIQFGNMDGHSQPITIVGVVGDVRDRNVEMPPRPTLYANARQRPNRTAQFTTVIHGTADPAWLIGRAGEIVRALDPDVPPRFRTIEQVVATSVANRRFSLLLLSVFAGAALLLAVIGIYGVMSYVVTQRTQEMGVRLALGATPGAIARLVLGQGARLVMIGLTLGVVGAALLTRLMTSLLFEVTPTDPVTYGGVALVLAATAVAACQIPAWRATRVDPLTALRSE
jgi:putative ABC transport system permease protein